MIATVAFFAEGPVLESMLMGNVWVVVMHKGVREVFTRTRAWFKDVKLVSGVWWGVEDGMEEAQLL